MSTGRSASWLLLSVGAIISSAAHVAIDFAAGVYPSDLRGHLLVTVSAVVVYAVWMRALSLVPTGAGGAIRLAAITALVQAGLANGLIGFFPCPPVALWGGEAPCAFSPWQDFAHLGSMVFGIAAFFVLRRHPVTSAPAKTALFRLGVAALVVHTLLAWVAATV